MSSEPKAMDAMPDAMAAECGRLEAGLSALLKILDEHRDLIDEHDAEAHAIREITDSVEKGSREFLEKSRLLRLGIVGQVKAGKSSLLNMLLFDGQEVLPKAATPMTASLSHIVKCDRDEIEIEYYSREDWDEVVRHADEYQRRMKNPTENRPDDFLQGSHEMVEMAKKNSLSVGNYLGTRKVVPTSLEDLNGELRRLVGAGGKLTPLVKSVTIRCSQGIPDLDIVDTPGINDPIVSRSREAKKLLSQCDVVVLLSYAGQFMDNVDAQFFRKSIPQESATQGLRQLLIGSKFDSALIDESRKYRGDLQEGVEKLKQVLIGQANNAIEGDSDVDRSFSPRENDILFISAMCAILATKPISRWSREERGYFDNLRRAYPAWLDEPKGDELNPITRKTLADLGNQDAIVKHLDEVRRGKDQIILDSIQDFLQKKREDAIKYLEELINDLDERTKELVESDLEGIQKQQEAVDEMVNEIGDKVFDCWQWLLHKQTMEGFNKLDKWVREWRREAREGVNRAVETITRTGERTRWLNLVKFRSPFETYTYEEQVFDDCAARAVIEDMRELIGDEVEKLSERLFGLPFALRASKEIFDVISEELSSEVAHLIKPTAIRRAVRQAIDKIARQGLGELKNRRPSFSADIELSSSASRGRRQALEELESIMKQVRLWTDKAKEEVEVQTIKAKEALVPAATAELKEHLDRLERDINEREFKLQRYRLCKSRLVECGRELRQTVLGSSGEARSVC